MVAFQKKLTAIVEMSIKSFKMPQTVNEFKYFVILNETTVALCTVKWINDSIKLSSGFFVFKRRKIKKKVEKSKKGIP